MKLWEFIEYENDDQLLVYKHPCQDFNTNTKLIVREGQVAIFLHNGQVADIFKPGRHKLSTENLPVLGKLMRIFTDGVNTFSAEVYFISTTNVMSLKWGTTTSMDLQDPLYKIICKVNGCGEASFQIVEPLAFFKTFVGTSKALEKADLTRFFRSLINMHIKNAVSSAISRDRVSILEINSHLIDIAKATREDINSNIGKDGVIITYFAFDNLGVKEGDDSLEKLKQALAKRAEMDIVGYSYQQERSFDVMDTMASKTESGFGGIGSSIIDAGIGLGVAGAVAGSMRNMATPLVQQTTAQFDTTTQVKCHSCGAMLPSTAKFCFECGAKLMKKRFCVNCGVELSPNAKFCFECGAKQE